jgi:predicted nucleic acid-binding protein
MTLRLVDTSVLLRGANRQDVDSRLARKAVHRLRYYGESLCIVPQNLYEFWAVSTRPLGRNGLALKPEYAVRVLQRVEKKFLLLPDPDELYEEWKRLVSTHRVSGKPSHDARLVAAMNLHGIRALLTFNVQDFTRYPNLSVLHPNDV